MKTKHVIPHKGLLSSDDRRKILGHGSAVVWLTGLSGSGKSTIAHDVERRLMERGIHSYVLDGDNVRSGLNKDLGFSDEDRKENIRRIGEVAALLSDAGLVVITAFISPFRQEREMASSLVARDRFYEVYLKCPLDLCEERDPKGLYKKARSGEIEEFTGIDSPYEVPDGPELVLDTGALSIEECAGEIVELLEKAEIIG